MTDRNKGNIKAFTLIERLNMPLSNQAVIIQKAHFIGNQNGWFSRFVLCQSLRQANNHSQHK